MSDLFKYLTGYHRQQSYKKILVAPVAMRKQFAELIDVEIANAMAGKKASITCKMNGLDDRVMVQKLYEAAQAGVQVDLIVRGICRMRPGIKGVSEKVRVVSIIGRFLEHHRVFRFDNDGDPKFYIGSADWMSRNLIRRVEVCVPIENSLLKAQLQSLLDACLSDEIGAWEMTTDGRYRKPCRQCKEHEPAGCAPACGPCPACVSFPAPPRLRHVAPLLCLPAAPPSMLKPSRCASIMFFSRDGRLASRAREVGLHNALIEVRIDKKRISLLPHLGRREGSSRRAAGGSERCPQAPLFPLAVSFWSLLPLRSLLPLQSHASEAEAEHVSAISMGQWPPIWPACGSFQKGGAQRQQLAQQQNGRSQRNGDG